MSTTPVIPPARKGFLASLLDPSFSTLVTTRVIRFLYLLLLVLIGIGLVVWIIAAIASGSATEIVLALIVGPLVTLVYVIYARVFLEVIMAIFRILESSREIAFLQREQLGLMRQQADGPQQPPAA
jgi:Domain of unknown function (DUF4282)